MRRRFNAARLLLGNLFPAFSDRGSPTHAATSRGTEYDLYEPGGNSTGTYILVYGLDLAGEKDSRLVRFARGCAAAGLRAAIPVLPGLKSYQFLESDLEALVDLVDWMSRQHPGPIGMIGFSAGGSYALLAAADRRAVQKIDPLFLLSPYYTLPELFAGMKTQPPEESAGNEDWDHFIWCRLVLAYKSLDRLGLSQQDQHDLIDLLWNYCTEGKRRKRAFYDHVLCGLLNYDVEKNLTDPSTLERFSLNGKLGNVLGKVLILHDPTDRMIPLKHSQKIIAELEKRNSPAGQKLLVTGLISHVSLRYAPGLQEVGAAYDMLTELFERESCTA